MKNIKLYVGLALALGLMLCALSRVTAQSWGGTNLGVDKDGNPILERENFEERPGLQGAEILPPGWTSTCLRKMANNVEVFWIRNQGGGRLGTSSENVPSKAGEGKWNVGLIAADRQGLSMLITPPVDLSKRRVRAPALRFMYASLERVNGESDKMQIQYRTSPTEQWKTIQEGGKPRQWGVQGSWEVQTVLLADALKGESDDKLRNVQFAFYGELHAAFGLCVDDVMIVELEGHPVKVVGANFQQFSGPVGEGTQRNEAARFSAEISAGVGEFQLDKFGLEYTGDSKDDIDKLWLYHTTSATFYARDEDKVAELKFGTGNTIETIEWQGATEEQKKKNKRFRSGKHYFWVVVDTKSGDNHVKHKVSFKLPAHAIKLNFYNPAIKEPPQPGGSLQDYSYPTELLETAQSLRIYKTLYKTDFEQDAENQKWKQGELPKQGGGTYKPWLFDTPAPSQKDNAAPTVAFSGVKVLATGIEKTIETRQYLYGQHPKSTEAKASVELMDNASINTKHYSDVRLRARYTLGADAYSTALVMVKPNGKDWVTAWRETNKSTTDGWTPLALDLSSYTSRSESILLKFAMDCSREEGGNGSGFFLDDIQVLGNAINNDVGVSKIEPPTGFTFDNTSTVKVTVKNYGSGNVDLSKVKVKVILNGEEKEVSAGSGTLAPDATTDVSVTGLNMTPDPNQDNVMTLEAYTVLADDDDPTNNRQSIRFYAFPTFEVSSSKSFPTDPNTRMKHWFPEPVSPTPIASWILASINQLQKGKDAPFSGTLPYSAFVWTTGGAQCAQQEKSTLTGPILELKEDTKKQLVVAYALRGENSGATPSNVKVHFEYRKENGGSVGAWTRLEKGSGAASNWYDASQFFNDNGTGEAEKKYKIAKVELPEKMGKIQVRIVFEDEGASAPGVAVNQVIVQTLRPNFLVESISPTPGCEPKVNEKLKIKLKNEGPVDATSFECPVEVLVYEKHATGTEPTLLGSHLVTITTGALASGASIEKETDIVYPWDYSDYGYDIEVRLKPERATPPQVDGDPSDNVKTFTYVPNIIPFSPIPQYNPLLKAVFVEKIGPQNQLVIRPYGAPYGTSSPYHYPRVPGHNRLTFMVDNFTQVASGPNPTVLKTTTAPIMVQSATYSAAGKSKIVYKYGKYNDEKNAPTVQGSCVKNEEFEIKETKATFVVESFQFPQQTNPSGTEGCYFEGGEEVSVVLKQLGNGGEQNVRIRISANGTELPNSPFPVGEVQNTVTQKLSGVKIPAGYSDLFVCVEVKTSSSPETWEAGPTNLVTYEKELQVKDRALIYRWKAPDPVPVFVQNVLAHDDIYQLGYNSGTGEYDPVANYTQKTLQLYVAPQRDVTYKWKKGAPDATGDLTADGSSTNVQTLGSESASYQVVMSYGKSGCGEKRSKIIRVRSDDLGLLNFSGLSGEGICPGEGNKGTLKVDVVNNSHTTYPKGTNLKFKLTKNSDPAKEIDVQLPQDLGGNQVTTLELPPLDITGAAGSVITLKLEFVSIAGKPDENKDNNVLEQKIRVHKNPVVTIEGEVRKEIRRRFTSSDVFDISPTYSPDCVGYDWSSKEDITNPEFKDLNIHTPKLNVSGIPNDIYKVKATNAVGCSAEATVEYIQTDFGITGFLAPASACSLDENADVVTVNLQNFGSKELKQGLKATLTVKLENEQLFSGQIELTEALAPGATYRHTVQVEGLKAKLKGKTSVRFDAELKVDTPGFKDLDERNNKHSYELKAYGYPSVSVHMKTNGTYDTEIEDGSTHTLYTPKEMFKLSSPAGNTDQLLKGWKYTPDQTPPATIDDTKEEIELPTDGSDGSKMRSLDKRGSGHYHAYLENQYGCNKSTRFTLNFVVRDLELEKVEGPEDACSFNAKEKATVTVKNKGSETIAAGAKLKVTVTQKSKSPEVKKESGVSLPHPMGPDNSYTFEVELDMQKDVKNIFEVVVEFADEEYKKYDLNTDNNKKMLTIEDFTDVTVAGLEAMAKLGGPGYFTPLTDPERDPSAQPLTYEPVVSGQENSVEVQLSNAGGASLDGVTFAWTWESGIQSSSQKDKQKIEVKGSGKVCLTSSKTYKTSKGADVECKSKACGLISSNSVDFAITEVMGPQSNCWANYEKTKTLPVGVKVTNVGGKKYVKGTTGKGTMTVSYTVYESNGTVFIPTVTGTPVPLPAELEPQRSVTISGLPQITKLLSKGAKYKVEFVVTTDPVVETGFAMQNNKHSHEFELYSEAKIPDGKLGPEPDKFYKDEATIGITEPAVEKDFQKFEWKDPNGAVVLPPTTGEYTPSTRRVSVPGTYTLTFEDKNGCPGVATKTVEFPGFIELEEQEPMASPKTDCGVGGEAEDLSLTFMNRGKSTYTKREIPVRVTLTPSSGSPQDFDAKFQMTEDLAAGEKVTLTASANKVNMHAFGTYQFKFEIGEDDADRKNAPAANKTDHPAVEKTLYRLVVPEKVTDLKNQAEVALHALLGSGATIDLDKIPRKVSGTQTTFQLNGLNPNGLSGAMLNNLTYEWTAGANRDAQFNLFNESGVYACTVHLKHKIAGGEYTCSSTSDEQRLRYTVTYTLLVEGRTVDVLCLKEGEEKPVTIAAKVTLKEADEPLEKGTKVKMAYKSSKGDEEEKDYTLEENIAEGQSFDYEFSTRPSFGIGDHKVELKATYEDVLGDKYPSELGTLDIKMGLQPDFHFNPDKVVVSGSEYQIDAPKLPEGPTYTYSWNSGQFTTPSIVVKRTGAYELTVTTDRGCMASSVINVFFGKKISWTVQGSGSVVVQLIDVDGNVVKQLSNGDAVAESSKVKVIATPREGNELNAVVINERRKTAPRKGYEEIIEVTEDQNIVVTFKETDGDEDTAVESTLLDEAYCTTPFNQTLVLFNTQHVLTYEVINQVGVQVMQGDNRAGAPRIELSTPTLGEGLYLIRLHGTDGSVRTLRAIRSR